MAFHGYILGLSTDLFSLYQPTERLQLAGPQGLIASWIKAHPETAAKPWALEAEEICRLAKLPSDGAILFTQEAVPTGDAVMRLAQIHGECREDRTDLLLTFEMLPLRPDQSDGHFPVCVDARATRRVSEALALSGGLSESASSTWNWTKPQMDLGATILG